MRSNKRRKPRADWPEQPSESAQAPAPRINLDNSTLSLRQQLQLARANAHSSLPSKPVTRTKFRRRKHEVARSGKRAGDVTDLPDGKYDLQQEPLLFIDAYNVIGAWPRLRKWRDRAELDTARRLLIDDVVEYAHVRGWECVVVFDAQGVGEDTRVEHTEQNIQVVFTGGESADSYIERSVFEACEGGQRQVWAATSDVAQLNFSKGKGAHVMTSTLFIQEIKRARRETRDKLARKDENCVRAKMLLSTVSEETRNKLYELRDKLEGS